MTALPGFSRRLRDGVYQSVANTRQRGHDKVDDAALRGWPPPGTFSALDTIHDTDWNPTSTPEQIITKLTAQLLDRSRLLDAVIYAPDKALNCLLAATVAKDTGRIDAWIAMSWTAEAAWQAVTGELPAAADPLLTPEDLVQLRPLAARLRFLVLSEPMRARGPGKWWDWPPDQHLPGGDGVFGRVLGERSSWTSLVDTCREARASWQDFLDNHQDYRLLRLSDAPTLEDELRLVLFRDDRWSSRPLALSTTRLVDPAALTYEDRELVRDAVERHLLPRFALGAVARLVLDEDHAWRRLASTGLSVLVIAAATAAVALAALRELHIALYAVTAVYALICLGIVALRDGPTWVLLWLLRMPAASAVGIIALDSFMPGGWLDKPTKANPVGWAGALGWHAVAVLAIASFGYLLIEARNHGVSPLRAVVRAFLVTVIGAVHALLVSLVGLLVVAPAFVPNGYQLHGLWTTLSHSQEAMLLALATSWCLAFGVFSQILWDDRPITASLAHLSWRRGK